MSNEWYLEEHKNKVYLHNKILVLKPYNGLEGTHNHCEVCWARISKYQCDLQRGYFEPESGSWICPECFDELASLFGWEIEQPDVN